MPKIKTREKVQGIKTLDKAAVAGERMKEVYIRSKEQFTNLTDDRSENPNAYAGDKVQRAAENAADCSCCCGWCKTGSEKRNSGNQAAQGTICGTDAGAGDAQSAMG